MEYISGIVEKLKDNPIGIVGLAMLILGFLAHTYFAKEKDWRVKFGSMAFVALGLLFAIWSVVQKPAPPDPDPVVVEKDYCEGVDIALVPGNAVQAANWCGTTGATRTTRQQAQIDRTPSCIAYAQKSYADLTQNQLYVEGRRLAREKQYDDAFERIDACQCHNPVAQALIAEGKKRVVCHLAKG
jgi:hypothetical protein